MAVDYKTARHICNVIRRQVQDSFPGLYIHFVAHPNGKRDEYYQRDAQSLHAHQTGKDLANHISESEKLGTLLGNNSSFTHMAYRLESGWFGIRDKHSYYALCFLNYEHFNSDEELRNHTYHLAWHALDARCRILKYTKTSQKLTIQNDGFSHESNILKAHKAPDQNAYDNFTADIFAVCAQHVENKETAIKTLTDQRINITLTAKPGFAAEEFPFPVCIDTLHFMLSGKAKNIPRRMKMIAAAERLALSIVGTYDDSVVEQWQYFSTPAQKMAWAGQTPATILGAAIYTGQSAYMQSIADMISEYSEIKAEVVTTLQSHNPFDEDDANTSVHKAQCMNIIDDVLKKIKTQHDIIFIIETAQPNHEKLISGDIMGWCSTALLTAARIIQTSEDELILQETLDKAKAGFTDIFNTAPYEYLVLYFDILKEKKQSTSHASLQDIAFEISKIEKLAPLHDCIETYDQLLRDIEHTQKERQSNAEDKNIMDFISPNAIKS